MKEKKLYLIAGVIAFFIIICPFVLSRFQLRVVTEIVILTLFVQTWRMMLHDGGMFSFGHALYFGLGAYGAALCWIHIPGLSFQNGILIGGMIAAAGAFIIGTCLVRLSGTYMAITTMAFNQLVWAIVWKWRGLTGGDDGLGNFPKPDLWIISMNDPVNFYYVTLLFIGVCLFFCWYFSKTPLGTVVKSIKSNEERAKFLGFNVNSYKLIFLTFLSFLCGIAGALYASFQELISASVIDISMSTNVLIMAYIGGISFFWGPFVGSMIFVYLSEYLSSFTDRWEFILGAIFIFIVLFASEGIIGVVRKKK